MLGAGLPPARRGAKLSKSRHSAGLQAMRAKRGLTKKIGAISCAGRGFTQDGTGRVERRGARREKVAKASGLSERQAMLNRSVDDEEERFAVCFLDGSKAGQELEGTGVVTLPDLVPPTTRVVLSKKRRALRAGY